MNENIIAKLQQEAKQFITYNKLILNGVEIYPKEIEVYYYKEGELEDKSGHRNELQKNNKNHFYIHRWGTSKCSPYRGGTRQCLDFVVSDKENTYYSYLIRSAFIKKDDESNLIVGPNRVFCQLTKFLSYEELENGTVYSLPYKCENGIVLFSKRINLCKDTNTKFCDNELKKICDSELRAVLCDDFYVSAKYPLKENMIINYLKSSDKNQDKHNNPIDFCKKRLNYVPSKIKEYYGNKN